MIEFYRPVCLCLVSHTFPVRPPPFPLFQIIFMLKHAESFGRDGDLTDLLKGLDQYKGQHVLMDRVEAMRDEFKEKVRTCI